MHGHRGCGQHGGAYTKIVNKQTTIAVAAAIFIICLGAYVQQKDAEELHAPSVSDDSKDMDAMDTGDTTTVGEIEIYDGIRVASDVTELDLSGRNLSGSLKAEIRFLTALRVLNLSDNNFTGLPAEVGQLSQLEVLDLSNNPLTGLPYEIGNLRNLQFLDLRGTQYAESDLQVISAALPATTQILVE